MTSGSLSAFGLGLVLLAAVPVGHAFGQPGQQQLGQRTEGTMVADVTELRATVETVDPAARQVLVRGPEGALVTLHVRPDVRNLAELKPGDSLVVRYTEALAARLARPDESGGPISMQAGTAASDPGQPGGVAAGDQVRAVVAVQAVYPSRNTLVVVGPAGVPRTVVVQDPAMQEFARGLKPGDRVELTYREAMAISVKQARR